ncbi:unnamed protein product [Trichogramma brassicae]|uniref:Uncharacterized protein n=1 Tax=Trichogramma brassicae TaxID=86971 RepID=A0A6H5HWX7_9HYME|nr:unnamed protein product [Trichogramma brassicae]
MILFAVSSFTVLDAALHLRRPADQQNELQFSGGTLSGEGHGTNVTSSRSPPISASSPTTARSMGSVLHILPIAGLYTFPAEYLESQFRLAAHSANLISGVGGILVMGLGIILSGVFHSQDEAQRRFVAAVDRLDGPGVRRRWHGHTHVRRVPDEHFTASSPPQQGLYINESAIRALRKSRIISDRSLLPYSGLLHQFEFEF